MKRREIIAIASLPVMALPLFLAADGERPPSILALMHRQYTVSRAPFKAIKAQSALATPDWTKVQEAGESFKALAEDLAKRTPRKGSADSWRDLIASHLEDTKAVEEAARAQDAEALQAARVRIETACAACHKVHRGRRGD